MTPPTKPLTTTPSPDAGDLPSDTPLDQAQPLWDHLEEFRVRLIKSLVTLAAATVPGYYLTPRLIEHLSLQVGGLIFLAPTEAFMARLKLALIVGVILSAPVILYHLWRFVGVALTVSERRVAGGAVPFSFLLFLAGAAMAWFVVIPAGLQFLMSFGTSFMKPQMSVDSVVGFSLWLSLGMGLLFQLPVVLGALARWGFVTAAGLRSHRRHAFLAILVAAAVLTPGPDVTSQLLLAAPTYLLFELSIFLAVWLAPKGG
jgi:sec-independent protein translocase protein TatC